MKGDMEQTGLAVLGLTALWDSISVYIGPSPKDREKEEKKDRGEWKCPNKPHRTYCKRSRPCPTVIKIVGRPGTGSLPSTLAPPDHPHGADRKAKVLNRMFQLDLKPKYWVIEFVHRNTKPNIEIHFYE